MGRPREFDIDKALDTAGELFWRNGYDRTSLSDLTEAIGITPPSFYFAFGNKEKLFKQVIDRYQAGHLGFFGEVLRLPTACAVVRLIVIWLCGCPHHQAATAGVVSARSASSAPFGVMPTRFPETLADRRPDRSERHAKAFQTLGDGDLPADADPDTLARYVLTVGSGMAVEAQSGASREDLYRTVKLALKSLPA